MNNDVVLEILSHLPVRSLLRFKAVCKFWGDVIDSPLFKKVHSTNKDKDEEVYLQYAISDNSISLKLLNLGKSLKSHCFNTKLVLVIDGPVKGLICISPSRGMIPIAIRNPCLGQSKILPVSPSFSSSSHSRCNVVQRCGIGFDEDYKVVQMVSCLKHRCIEANLYSKRTNSWREMSIDQELIIVFPIQSLCKNGSFAHWEALEVRGLPQENIKRVILSFDMKNEVFRKITLPGGHDLLGRSVEILAKDDYSFVFFVLSTERRKVMVYESSGEGSELVWIHVANVKVESPKTPILRSDACVKSKNSDTVVLRLFFLKKSKWVLYDYRAREIIAYLKLPVASDSAIIKYEGSLVLLKKEKRLE